MVKNVNKIESAETENDVSSINDQQIDLLSQKATNPADSVNLTPMSKLLRKSHETGKTLI